MQWRAIFAEFEWLLSVIRQSYDQWRPPLPIARPALILPRWANLAAGKIAFLLIESLGRALKPIAFDHNVIVRESDNFSLSCDDAGV